MGRGVNVVLHFIPASLEYGVIARCRREMRIRTWSGLGPSLHWDDGEKFDISLKSRVGAVFRAEKRWGLLQSLSL